MERTPISTIMSTKIQSALLVTMLTSFLFGGRECRRTVLFEPALIHHWAVSCFSGLPKPATILILPGDGWRAIGSFMVFHPELVRLPLHPCNTLGRCPTPRGVRCFWGYFDGSTSSHLSGICHCPSRKICKDLSECMANRTGLELQLNSLQLPWAQARWATKTGRSMSWKLLGHVLATTAITQHHQTSGLRLRMRLVSKRLLLFCSRCWPESSIFGCFQPPPQAINGEAKNFIPLLSSSGLLCCMRPSVLSSGFGVKTPGTPHG